MDLCNKLQRNKKRQKAQEHRKRFPETSTQRHFPWRQDRIPQEGCVDRSKPSIFDTIA